MKTQTRQGRRRFHLEIRTYGNSYYTERVAKLESVLRKKPRTLRIEMSGIGEIPADAALRIRAALLNRSSKTQIITSTQSSLQGGSVLVWLLGDSRVIRDDAKLFFRRVDESEIEEVKPDEDWKTAEPKYQDSYACVDPEEADYARVLELINEFLPVKEMAGRLVGAPVLRQFGLIENEKVDSFLAGFFSKSSETTGNSPRAMSGKHIKRREKVRSA